MFVTKSITVYGGKLLVGYTWCWNGCVRARAGSPSASPCSWLPHASWEWLFSSRQCSSWSTFLIYAGLQVQWGEQCVLMRLLEIPSCGNGLLDRLRTALGSSFSGFCGTADLQHQQQKRLILLEVPEKLSCQHSTTFPLPTPSPSLVPWKVCVWVPNFPSAPLLFLSPEHWEGVCLVLWTVLMEKFMLTLTTGCSTDPVLASSLPTKILIFSLLLLILAEVKHLVPLPTRLCLSLLLTGNDQCLIVFLQTEMGWWMVNLH